MSEPDEFDRELLTYHVEGVRKAFGGSRLVYLVVCKKDNNVIATIDADEDEMPKDECARMLFETSLKMVADLHPVFAKVIAEKFVGDADDH